MVTRFDVGVTGGACAAAADPMIDPRLGIDELEQSHALEIGHRALTGERLLHGRCIDDPVPREVPAEQPFADAASKMIEQP